MKTRLIATVSATGSVDIRVAPGRVRVETAFAAMPTSARANITTARPFASWPKSVKVASSDQEMP